MSFGFPAYATGSQIFQLSQQQLTEIVAAALNQLGWRFINPSATTFLANNSFNIWSWGEKINMKFVAMELFRREANVHCLRSVSTGARTKGISNSSLINSRR